MNIYYQKNFHLMKVAFVEAEKSICPRTKVGCILVKNGTILASAHNDEITGFHKCSNNGCIRITKGLVSGQNPELCRGLHAEQKLIINCALNGINPFNSSIYITHSPCISCAKMLLESGIRQLYYCIDYPDAKFKNLFNEVGIGYYKIDFEKI